VLTLPSFASAQSQCTSHHLPKGSRDADKVLGEAVAIGLAHKLWECDHELQQGNMELRKTRIRQYSKGSG
jgi:hypothetical protein